MVLSLFLPNKYMLTETARITLQIIRRVEGVVLPTPIPLLYPALKKFLSVSIENSYVRRSCYNSGS
jgi:hypothetical protein